MLTLSSLNELGAIIDKACDTNNLEELTTIISFHSEYTDSMKDSLEKTYSYYLLGNAWNGIRKINHQENIDEDWSLEQEEVFQEIYYFRKVIQQENFKEIDLSIQLATYVNLGNAFSHYGRTVNAIKYSYYFERT